MTQTILNVLKYLAYALLAGYSSWMTATSVQLKWMKNAPLALTFVFIFIFAILSGLALKWAIKQMRNSIDPSLMKIAGSMLMFLLFWGFSFWTNVHYNVINQHGYDNINQQLRSCIVYLDSATNKASQANENEIRDAKLAVKAKVDGLMGKFENSLDDSRPDFKGFGPDCKKLLISIATELNNSNSIYNDKNTYVVFDEQYHNGYLGVSDYTQCRELKTKFEKIVSECLNRKFNAIDTFFKSIANSKDLLEELKTAANTFEKEELAKIKGSGDFKAYYECYRSLKESIIDKMPENYKKNITKMVKDKDGNERYILYPSDRMFDVANVWGDWWDNRLPEDINLKGQFLWSFLIDFAAYVLICL